MATFFNRFVATLLFFTLAVVASGSPGAMRGSGSSSAPSGPIVAWTVRAGSGSTTTGAWTGRTKDAAAAMYSAEGCLISISSGSFARGSMISTVTPMTPGLSFAAAKPRSIHKFRGSPQYLM